MALLIVPLLIITGIALYYMNYVGVETDLGMSALLADPPQPIVEPITIKVVTYNIQALWVVGMNRPARMKALGEELTELDPDIVGFQEVFVPENRALLLECLKGSRLKYHQYYPSRLVGSGLLIMSAYPIREVFFHQYKASNPWYRVWEGDWWAGKGVALARIELPDGSGFLDFYDTHAQAGYGIPDYREVRKFQMGELARFVNASHLPTAAGLLVGDMNCGAGSDDFEIAVTGAKLVRQMAVPSAIDHIFEVATPPATIEVSESLEIRERNGLRLSDHNGYVSTIVIRPS